MGRVDPPFEGLVGVVPPFDGFVGVDPPFDGEVLLSRGVKEFFSKLVPSTGYE